MAFGPNEPFDRHYDKSFLGKPVEAVRICVGNIPGAVVARPIDPVSGEALKGMMGGCYVASSDSRFWAMVQKVNGNQAYGAVALHDRFEW